MALAAAVAAIPDPRRLPVERGSLVGSQVVAVQPMAPPSALVVAALVRRLAVQTTPVTQEEMAERGQQTPSPALP